MMCCNCTRLPAVFIAIAGLSLFSVGVWMDLGWALRCGQLLTPVGFLFGLYRECECGSGENGTGWCAYRAEKGALRSWIESVLWLAGSGVWLALKLAGAGR